MSNDKRVRNPITNPEVFVVADGTSAEANLGYSNVEQVKSKLGVNNLQVTGANAVNLQAGTNSVTLNTITLRSASPSSDVTLPAGGAIATVASVVQSFPQATTTYTLLATDNGKILEFTSPAPVNVVLPITTGFPTGFNVTVTQKGGGRVTFLPTSSSVNLRHPYNSNSTLGQFATCRLYVSAVNEYILSGDTNNQGAITQPGGGSSSVISTIKEISDTDAYFLQLSDNNVTLQINVANDFYLLIPEDLPVGYNVELFKIGQGRIILNQQGKSRITHPNLHNALTGNFAKARLQVISSSQLNTLWSFTGDTAFVNTELLNAYYNLTLAGDELKRVNVDLLADAPISFTFTVKKFPPEIPFQTFWVDPKLVFNDVNEPSSVSDVIVSGGLIFNQGSFYAGPDYFRNSKPNLSIETGTVYKFIIRRHNRFPSGSSARFRILQNGQNVNAPEAIVTDTSGGDQAFNSYEVTWNVPANPTGTYTYGWGTNNTLYPQSVGNITIINRSINTIAVAWSIAPIENLSASDFIGGAIPQGSLSFARSAATEEKTFSFSLKNIPDLTDAQQKLFRVNIASAVAGVNVINNFVEARLSEFIPTPVPDPDPSAFANGFGHNILITSVTTLSGTGRFLFKVDRRCVNQDLTVGKFLSINKEPSSAVERRSLNQGSYLITQITDNSQQDVDVEVIKPFGYITGSTFSAISIQGENRTQVILTVKWIGFVPPSSYPLLVRDHITSIANSFAINTDPGFIPPEIGSGTYLFRYAPESVTRVSTNVNGVTTDQITYIVNVPYSPSLNNFPFTGQANDPNNPNPFQGITFSTIIDNGQTIPFSGTVTIAPITFSPNAFSSTTGTDGIRRWFFPSDNDVSLLFYGQTRYIIEILPRASTIATSRILLVESQWVRRDSTFRRIENLRLAFQDQLSVNDEFTLTSESAVYSQSYLSLQYPEGRYKITNINQKSVRGQSRIVDIDVEVVSTDQSDKPYIGIAWIFSSVGLNPRNYTTGRIIIETNLIEYTQGKLPRERIGTIIARREPQSYYSDTITVATFQITGNNDDGFFGINSSGEITLTTIGAQSHMNNASELPNERVIEVTPVSFDTSHSNRKNITLRVLPAST